MSQVSSFTPSVTITEFLISDTWTKKANTQWVKVYIWSAGSGGGSGRRGTGSVGGGAGGTGGNCAYYSVPASVFGPTEPVVVGTGGAGGSAVTIDNTSGNPGAGGGFSGFGDLILNTQAATLGGTGATVASQTQLVHWEGSTPTALTASGGEGRVIAGGPAAVGGGTTTGINGGLHFRSTGGGGGSGASSVSSFTGGDGGPLRNPSGTTLLAAGIGAPGGTAQDGTVGTDGNPAVLGNGYWAGGTGGGGGGGGSATLPGSRGGNGGFPGGGGGGGGGGLNGFNSGAGGNGANGKVVVIEFS